MGFWGMMEELTTEITITDLATEEFYVHTYVVKIVAAATASHPLEAEQVRNVFFHCYLDTIAGTPTVSCEVSDQAHTFLCNRTEDLFKTCEKCSFHDIKQAMEQTLGVVSTLRVDQKRWKETYEADKTILAVCEDSGGVSTPKTHGMGGLSMPSGKR